MTVEMNLAASTAGATRVQLQGRLDAAGADAIGLRFTAAAVGAARDVLIDLTGVSFIASLGLRLLISTARAVAARGHQMALFGATELVQETLADSALDQLMPIAATEAEALAALAG